MIGLLLLPAALSLLVLGAHFLRAGNRVLVAVVLVLLGLLGVRRRWACRLVQIALLLGAAEWVRTTIALARWRSGNGQPFVRMIVILAAVTLVTALSALAFRSARLRRWYGREP